MKYLSVCAGIEAASMAWHRIGWSPVAFSEIEKFPSAVLAHHYPHIPNYGDMTKFEEWPDHAIDLLVGGTPCQSFSVAGLRQGLADPRGNLMLTYLAIARRYQPKWLVWENVPGVLSSNGGRDFGTFIRGLEECGYHAAWRVLDAQYVRVDGYPRAVPQRRRRVFVVGYLGDWRRAAAVLFEREGMFGDTAPRRQAGEGIAPTISARPTGGGGLGTDFDCDSGLISMAHGQAGAEISVGHGPTLTCNHEAPIVAGAMVAFDTVARSLTARHDSSPCVDRGADIVATPYTLAIRGRDGQPDLEYRQDGTANAILTPNGGRAGIGVGAVAQPIAFEANMSMQQPETGGVDTQTALSGYLIPATRPVVATRDVAGALTANYGKQPDSSDTGLGPNLVATREVDATGNSRLRDPGFNVYEGFAPTLDTGAPHSVATGWAVRRLTPVECERLQGFPDNFTNIPWRGKPTAPDGPRYKALGNSMAVNCMRWIGRRINHVEGVANELAADDHTPRDSAVA